ncbi:hypothetical protein [Actinophytocola sp.]|uniref:hypothetical protein n=1 Tax=Actinophytocola sp. TaxID=1872138 RepID=UPI002ECFB4C9
MSRITRLGLAVVIAALPVVLPAPTASAQDDSAVEQTKEITNYGKDTTRNATVRVSRTANLFDRQQVRVDLAGFEPTWNANNTAVNGTRLQYPVVVMQCRGVDPDPTTCANEERLQWQAGFDVNATPSQRAVAERQSRPGDPSVYPGADLNEQYANLFRAEQLPFAAANGTSYLWRLETRSDGVPFIDEPNLKSFPPTDVTSEGAATINTRNIPIRPDGTNAFLFEVRQRASQSSLGCSDTQACSIVVVPIMDMACLDELSEDKPLPAEALNCGKPGRGPAPGESGATDDVNPFAASQQWHAESNWRNRFVVPISFAPDLQSCDVRDSRPPLPAYGSELVAVAQERWGAAYCTGARRADYLPVYTQGSEYFARRQLTTQLGAAYQQNAVFTSQPVTESPRPVAHAPTAITGFAVAFVVDDGNGAQVQNMTLSPRLLAKLITQSYNPIIVPPAARDGKKPYDGTQSIPDAATAARYYVAHPALFNNPQSLFADPEFADLNPDFALRSGTDALAPHLRNTINPMVFTVESDIMMDITRYVTGDPAARAWLDGQPDPYGMRVNPAWLNLEPTQIYTLLDTWVRPAMPRKEGWLESKIGVLTDRQFVYGGGDTCDEVHGTEYLTKVANVANAAKATALMLLDRRGSATPICTQTIAPVPTGQQAAEPQFPGDDVTQDVRFNETKIAPVDYGKRAQLALTTVAHAALYGLPTARLVNSAGQAIGPAPGTMRSALHAATVDPVTGTVQIDHTRVGADGYPGTMVAYTAVPTSGLDLATAGRYADFIEFMATTGQVPGPTLANLPPGYDPLPPSLVRQAKDAAAAVRAQRGEVPAALDDPVGEDTPPAVDQQAPAANPGSGLPVNAQNADDAKDADPERLAKTEDASSWLARWSIPLLIGFGLLAALVAFCVQVGARPDHPLRRGLDGLLRAVGRR